MGFAGGLGPAAWLLIGTVALAGAGYAAHKALNDDDDKKKSEDQKGGAHLKMSIDADAPVPLVYGRCRVGYNISYINTTGGDNDWLHMVGTLSEGPIDSINQVYLGDNSITAYPVWIATYEVIYGTATQTDPDVWNANYDDNLRYTAGLYIRLNWDAADPHFKKLPKVTCDMNGLKVWDPATDTAAFSTNNALIVYDIMTRPSYRGGMGLDMWHTATGEMVDNPDMSGTGGTNDADGTLTGSIADDWTAWNDTGDSGTVSKDGSDRQVMTSTSGIVVLRTDAIEMLAGKDFTVEIEIQALSGNAYAYLYSTGQSSTLNLDYTSLSVGTNTIEFTAASTDTSLEISIYVADGGSVTIENYSLSIVAQVDTAAIASAKSYCTSQGWTFSGVIRDQGAALADNIEQILRCMRGAAIYSEQTLKVLFRHLPSESVAMALTDNDMIADTLSVDMGDMTDKPNQIEVRYLSAGGRGDGFGKYQEVPYIYTDSAALAADGDTRKKVVKLHGLNSRSQLQPMAYYLLERARQPLVISATFGSRAIALEPLDIVTLTNSFTGYTTQKFRVVSTGLNADWTVPLVLEIESDEFYNDDYDEDDDTWPETSLPAPGDTPPAIVSVSASEVIYQERERSRVRLEVDWSRPSDYAFIRHIEVWVSTGDESNYRHLFDAVNDFYLDPVEEGEFYYFKLLAVSFWGTKQADADAYKLTHQVVGRSSVAPSDMTSLTYTVTDDSVFVRGDTITDADVAGYEFRISGTDNNAWNAATYLSYNVKPVWEINGMRSGTFKVFCSPHGRNGLYSDNPVSVTFTVADANGWTWYTNVNIDYDDTGDSFNGTEMHDTGGSEYSLRVDHTGSNLDGTYTSEEKDLSASGTYRIQGDFVQSVVDSSITMEDLWPSGTNMNHQDLSQTFQEMYGIDTASRLTAKLKYGTTSGSLNDEIDNFELRAATFTGRYVQVEVTMEDPHDSQYLMLDGPDADTVLKLRVLN